MTWVALAAACSRRPSAEIRVSEPEDERAASESEPEAGAKLDARAEESLCAHSYSVLAGESPSLRSAAVERDYIANCVAGNLSRRSELGEQRWAERSRCIEQAQTAAELGRCDGRTPRPEPNPSVVVGPSGGPQAVCQHVFDLLFAENPDMQTMIGPPELEKLLVTCTESVEQERLADPVKFDESLRCIMAATSVDALDHCEP